MSRRDTIIIAVLINAGLLLVLFATALPSSKEESEPEIVANQGEVNAASPVQPSAESVAITPADEVDQVLSEWNIKPGVGTLEVASLGNSEKSKLEEKNEGGKQEVMAENSIAALSLDAETSASADYTQVTVKKGDALEKIARAHGTSVQEITRLNQLSSSATLQVGQVLKVPSKKGNAVAATSKKSKSEKKEAKASKSSEGGQYYIVKSGDSPWLIANKNHIKLDDLLRLNNLDEAKARKLKPGDRIRTK